jgi:transcriptional regulator with XRE-family HTH domain
MQTELDYKIALGKRIKLAIQSSDLTVKEIANLLAVAETTVFNYSGGRLIPNAFIILNLARATKTDPVWLLTGSKDSDIHLDHVADPAMDKSPISKLKAENAVLKKALRSKESLAVSLFDQNAMLEEHFKTWC